MKDKPINTLVGRHHGISILSNLLQSKYSATIQPVSLTPMKSTLSFSLEIHTNKLIGCPGLKFILLDCGSFGVMMFEISLAA